MSLQLSNKKRPPYHGETDDVPRWFYQVFLEEVAEYDVELVDETHNGWYCKFCKTKPYRIRLNTKDWDKALDVPRAWTHYNKKHPEIVTVLCMKVATDNS